MEALEDAEAAEVEEVAGVEDAGVFAIRVKALRESGKNTLFIVIAYSTSKRISIRQAGDFYTVIRCSL